MSLRPKKVILAGAALLAVIAVGAGGAAAFWPDRGDTARAADDPGVAVPNGEEGRLGATLDGAGKTALSDGKVTNTEYLDAANAAVACIRAAGFTVSDPMLVDGRYSYITSGFVSKTALDAAKPILDGCYNKNLRGIDGVAALGRQ
ncbi:MAG: hypothetical protein HYX53_15190 [Chloroflexi bacterium]|nr:hypothetical protein [Chloroflexota bacterium]